MTIKDYYEFAVRNEMTDLYVLIMFLVYEKKVLSFDDAKDKIMFYLQDKFKPRMNELITEYKNKLNINYKPCVFEVQVQSKAYQTVYILAVNEKQATSYCFSQMYKPIDMSICDPEQLMTKYNKKNEPINLTIKQLRDRASEIPSFLGGY
ncbi:hypothetical protein [Virgibacillus sp. Bac332]|uniref:hypothetical protein n=1 Tax=Virgibacillus sp. Bac332 TaxID=2419842 RepID=UPI001969CE1B|nr:hypothetical protein [Virgibacillus sp. Bac332]